MERRLLVKQPSSVKAKCTHPYPQQTISVLVDIREIMPALSPELNAQNKVMYPSCTLQFSSAMPLLSEQEAK